MIASHDETYGSHSLFLPRNTVTPNGDWRDHFLKRTAIELIPSEERAKKGLQRTASFISELEDEALLLDDDDD